MFGLDAISRRPSVESKIAVQELKRSPLVAIMVKSEK